MNFISVHSLSAGRNIFTCLMTFYGDERAQLYVFSYGFPPSAVGPEPPPTARLTTIVYPNPFVSSFTLELPAAGYRRLQIFDLLGRSVYDLPIDRHTMLISMSDQQLRNLPTGTYFLSITGSPQMQTIKLKHIR